MVDSSSLMVGNFLSMVDCLSTRISLNGAASVVRQLPPLLPCLDILFLLQRGVYELCLYYNIHRISTIYKANNMPTWVLHFIQTNRRIDSEFVSSKIFSHFIWEEIIFAKSLVLESGTQLV